jgi:tetratricopeptide (TPR) repeat protein
VEKQSVGRRLYDIIKVKDGQEAISKYRQIKTRGSQTYNFDENELNDLAYQMIREKRIDDALELFKLNVEEYPNSANVFDILGEAYLLKGNKELAVQSYKISLRLNPLNKNAAATLKKIGKRD